jgi:outer membrane protein TolC
MNRFPRTSARCGTRDPARHAVASLMMLAIWILCRCAPLMAQQNPLPSVEVTSGQLETPPGATSIEVTLEDALKRALAMSPSLRQAITNARIAAQKPTQSRGTNLPTVSSNSQFLYTEGNGTPVSRYIANNGVHEYIAQVDVHQALSVANVILYRQSVVSAALAKDQTEIARRGLMVAVVQGYASLVAAKRKYLMQQQATQVSQNFLKTTEQLESGGEVAHADVVKAQVQYDDSQVALEDAELARDTARAALAMMLFVNVNQKYDVVDDPAQELALPPYGDAEAQARHSNPTLDAAFKNEHLTSQAIAAARAEYLPTITFDYFYGIDANHFAVNTPSSPTIDPELRGRPIQNLGYSALASITLPIWNWGATQSQVRSAEVLHHQAVLDRQFAQRKLIADLQQFYREAKTAQSEMEIRKSAAVNAEESAKLTLVQYKAGDATALEVVTAEDSLTLEQNAYADAQTRYATAIANLATLTGKL